MKMLKMLFFPASSSSMMLNSNDTIIRKKRRKKGRIRAFDLLLITIFLQHFFICIVIVSGAEAPRPTTLTNNSSITTAPKSSSTVHRPKKNAKTKIKIQDSSHSASSNTSLSDVDGNNEMRGKNSSTMLETRMSDDDGRDSGHGIIITNQKPKQPLRQRFEFVSNLKPIRTDESITHILMPPEQYHQHSRRTPTTFRPSSSVLYLHPPKPRHIDSMESVLTELNLTATKINVGWKLMVRLKDQQNIAVNINESKIIRSNRIRRRNRRKVEARVEEELNPLHYNIYLRRYGFTDREKYSIIDTNNTLDPPITQNQTYHYELDGLKEMNAYEFCLQSVNAGEIKETYEIRRQFPVNAQTELAGRNNPLFLCKEIVMPPPSTLPQDQQKQSLITETLITNRTNSLIEQNAKKPGEDFTRITGRSNNYFDNGDDDGRRVDISDDATDAFVLYTAITSGSTTVLILVIVTIFCCCRCRRKVQMENHHQTLMYDRVRPRDHPHNIIVPYSGYRT